MQGAHLGGCDGRDERSAEATAVVAQRHREDGLEVLYTSEPVPAAVWSPPSTTSLPHLMNVPTKDRPEREKKEIYAGPSMGSGEKPRDLFPSLPLNSGNPSCM